VQGRGVQGVQGGKGLGSGKFKVKGLGFRA